MGVTSSIFLRGRVKIKENIFVTLAGKSTRFSANITDVETAVLCGEMKEMGISTLQIDGGKDYEIICFGDFRSFALSST